jgi:hypothetical protein
MKYSTPEYLRPCESAPLNPDPEIRESSLVLIVVVLVLDLLGFCAEKEPIFLAIISVTVRC